MPSPTVASGGARRFWNGIATAIVAGGLLRIVYASIATSPPVSDGLHYSAAARLLARGEGFVNPLFLAESGRIQDGVHPPAWTVLLSLSARSGQGSDGAFRVVAAIVGLGTIVMVGLAARAAFGPRVGVVAAFVAALYPNLWLYEHELVSEPLALFGVATILWLTFRFRSRPGPVLAVLLGVAVAAAALTRSELILLSVLIVAPTIVLARVTWAKRATWAALAVTGCLLLIGPWTAYNRTRFEAPVPLSVGLGATMAAGNCSLTYDPALATFAYYEFACALLSPTTSSDPSVTDGQYRSNALRFISDHPGGFAATAAARVGRTFSVYAPLQQVELETERGTSSGVIRLALFTYWLLVPLAASGFVLARRRGVAVYPFVALIAVAVLAVVFTIGAVRYRAPAEPAIVILAAVAIEALFQRWSNRRGKARDRGRWSPVDPPDPHPSETGAAAPVGAAGVAGSPSDRRRRRSPVSSLPAGSHRVPPSRTAGSAASLPTPSTHKKELVKVAAIPAGRPSRADGTSHPRALAARGAPTWPEPDRGCGWGRSIGRAAPDRGRPAGEGIASRR